MPSPLTFDHEQQYWQQGIKLLAGIDEVGMGALAGPVVAGAVVFDPKTTFGLLETILPASPREAQGRSGDKGGKRGFRGVNDSKKLSPRQREKAAEWIKDHALAWAVGESSVEEITRLNIRAASHVAMRRAVDSLGVIPELLLLDGTPAQPHPAIPALNVIDGDALIFSIAAASIMAKVHRDAIMTTLDKEYPAYQFAGNKGYGSRLHLVALGSHGASPHHRPTYAPVTRVLTK